MIHFEDIHNEEKFYIEDFKESSFSYSLSSVDGLTSARILTVKNNKIYTKAMYSITTRDINKLKDIPYKQWIKKGYLRINDNGYPYTEVFDWVNSMKVAYGINAEINWNMDYNMNENGIKEIFKNKQVVYDNNPIDEWLFNQFDKDNINCAYCTLSMCLAERSNI